MKHTLDTLTALIRKNIEPGTAELVLDALRVIDGQLITTRVLDKLPGGRVEWRLSRQMGYTEIRNRAYISSQGSSPDGVCLTLARSEASVPLLTTWVERENPAYFAGRRERNALREKALSDPPMLSKLAALMNEIEEINARLACAETRFSEFVDYGQPCHPDKYDLERACGLREAKRGAA
jgi:hypothetical protein